MGGWLMQNDKQTMRITIPLTSFLILGRTNERPNDRMLGIWLGWFLNLGCEKANTVLVFTFLSSRTIVVGGFYVMFSAQQLDSTQHRQIFFPPTPRIASSIASHHITVLRIPRIPSSAFNRLLLGLRRWELWWYVI